MDFISTLLGASPYINMPQGVIGWAGWLIQLALIALALWVWRAANKPFTARRWALFGALTLAVLLTSLFFGVRLPLFSSLPFPDQPVAPAGALLLPLAAAPWALAAGFLGPLPAGLLGLLAGFLQARWNTHNPFLPLELALLAISFAVLVNQRYRTRFFRWCRAPLFTAALLALFYPLIATLNIVLTARGPLTSRVDFAFTLVGGQALTLGVELLLAGLIAHFAARRWPEAWGGLSSLRPAPAERSLQARLLWSMVPLALLLIFTLMLADWFIAGAAARRLLRDRMNTIANSSAANLPYFLNVGQSLISQYAAELGQAPPGADPQTLLQQNSRAEVFFQQLILLDAQGEPQAAFPPLDYNLATAPLEEQQAALLALQSALPPFHVSIPAPESASAAQAAWISFVASAPGGVLIGRTSLAENPLTRPVLQNLAAVAELDGQALLLDELGQAIYHTDANLLLREFPEFKVAEAEFYDGPAPNGARQFVYVQPASGAPWSVVVAVPASQAQQMALQIAAPLLVMIVVVSGAALVILRLGLLPVTTSLQNLSQDAARISQGDLDQPLHVEGVDEIGQLRRAFEHMRASLKARLDELNRLLLVSQGVASSLEIAETVQPVLESALTADASAARIVLLPTVVPELDGDAPSVIAFGAGPGGDNYAHLDEMILALTRRQESLVIPNLARTQQIQRVSGQPYPASLAAVALHNENSFFGALWVAYDELHHFSTEEVRFLSTLAGQAALAASNARLFLNAEIGRQRLAAILASTPDPVLVTDQRDRLLLGNLAAWRALGLAERGHPGQPIADLITQPELLALLHAEDAELRSAELRLPDGQIYLATASTVLAEGQAVGRVCALRDVTHFKELDALKSEFVSTVSHDLRSPLTLMRGYATMLEMVGELNEQQSGYVRQIVTGVESMSRLVNNLLDLGRIEAGIGLQLEIVPVHDIVERVVGALQLQALQKNIQLSYEIPQQTIPLVEADQALLQQALHNLIENAIKYTQEGGQVRLRVMIRQERMVFEVSDNGPGIPAVDQPRLFEKFYRGSHQISRDQRGTGLGLAIVKSIVERHGGVVWVESKLSKGSVFYIAIPLRQPETPKKKY